MEAIAVLAIAARLGAGRSQSAASEHGIELRHYRTAGAMQSRAAPSVTAAGVALRSPR